MGKIRKVSKRQPARLRYKIEKKVRDHNKKQRKLNKKKPPTKKSKLIQVPNICPFKEDILREVEEMKKQKEEEQQKRREMIKQERAMKKKAVSLEQMVASAETRNQIHTALQPKLSNEVQYGTDKKQENSLKAYYKEFKKVLDAADVILEVVDARDPLGTRCVQVEEAIRSSNKKLVLVLNKADLIPRSNLENWLKYLKQSVPAVPFKASTQSQTNQLGRRKMVQTKNDKSLQGSTCVGAELVMSLLANYCRNSGIKTSIRVGVVGLPNVGKSSLINSLIRSRACNVGAMPGITKAMQEVQLDSKIKLLDSPGIVFASSSKTNDSSIALKNALSITSLKDPFTPANAILQRADKQMLCRLYDILDFSSPKEFYAKKANRMGKLLKGGIPDKAAAARSLLEDWNSGKVRYYTEPPESTDVHLSASIVNTDIGEFDINSFQSMECDIIGQINCNDDAAILMESTGPVQAMEKMEEDSLADDGLIPTNINVDSELDKKKTKKPGKKTTNAEVRKRKIEPLLELEGNQKLNKLKKIEAKKIKKAKSKSAKHATQLADVLDNVTLSLD